MRSKILSDFILKKNFKEAENSFQNIKDIKSKLSKSDNFKTSESVQQWLIKNYFNYKNNNFLFLQLKYINTPYLKNIKFLHNFYELENQKYIMKLLIKLASSAYARNYFIQNAKSKEALNLIEIFKFNKEKNKAFRYCTLSSGNDPKSFLNELIPFVTLSCLTETIPFLVNSKEKKGDVYYIDQKSSKKIFVEFKNLTKISSSKIKLFNEQYDTDLILIVCKDPLLKSQEGFLESVFFEASGGCEDVYDKIINKFIVIYFEDIFESKNLDSVVNRFFEIHEKVIPIPVNKNVKEKVDANKHLILKKISKRKKKFDDDESDDDDDLGFDDFIF